MNDVVLPPVPGLSGNKGPGYLLLWQAPIGRYGRAARGISGKKAAPVGALGARLEGVCPLFPFFPTLFPSGFPGRPAVGPYPKQLQYS